MQMNINQSKIPTESDLLNQKVFSYDSFQLDLTGLSVYNKKKDSYSLVCDPIFVEKRFQNYQTGTMMMALKFWVQGAFVTKDFPMVDLSNIATFLADFGFPLTSWQALKVTEFIVTQQKETLLVKKYVTVGFLANEQADEQSPSLIFGLSQPIGVLTEPLEWQKDQSKFNVAPKGDLQQWIQMLNQHVIGHPPLEFLLAAGFSSVIVSYFKQCGKDQDSLFLGLTGKSTTGKTTGSKLAISIYGSPVKSENSLFQSWNSTENAIINKLTGNQGVVFLMDEFSMSTSNDTTSIIYRIVEGRDRARMNDKLALNKRGKWATTIITNGENSIIDKSNHNLGLMVRLLEFNESTQWTKDALHANAINEVIEQHYGHAGLAYVRYLAQDWSIIDRSVQAWQQHLISTLPESEVKHRMSDKYAILLTALELGGKALGIEFSLAEVEQFIFEHEKTFIAQRDNAERVYHAVIEDVRATSSQFIIDQKQPKGVTCKGIILSPSPSQNYYAVYYLTPAFEQLLVNLNISNKKTVTDALKRKPYFDHEADRQTKRVRLQGNQKVTTYAFKIPKGELNAWLT